MGFDFGDFFDQAGEKAQDALDDLVKVGVPTLQATLEQWGIDVLQRQNEQTQAQLNQAVADITKNDPPPGSLGAAFNTTIQGTILQTHGGLLIGVCAGLILLGLFLRGK